MQLELKSFIEPFLKKVNLKILVFWSILSKYFLHWKWPPVSSTSIFSALTLPKIKSKDSFEKLTTSRFQNCPYFSKLTKIWWRCWPKTNLLFFVDMFNHYFKLSSTQTYSCMSSSDPQATIPCWCCQVKVLLTLKTPLTVLIRIIATQLIQLPWK